MSLNRLKRQDLHTYMCSIVLLLINSCVFYLVNRSMPAAVLFTALYSTGCLMTGALELGVRKKIDLLLRHFWTSIFVFTVTVLIRGNIQCALLEFLLFNLFYGICMVAAKKWIRHELCPGWTMLLYDSRENLEKAKTIAESRKDLMIDTYHCAYGGSEMRDRLNEKEGAVSSISDVDNIIRSLHISQMVICLETGNEEMIKYCRSVGITAFVKENKVRNGLKIDREGLFCIRPFPALRERLYGKIQNGVMSR